MVVPRDIGRTADGAHPRHVPACVPGGVDLSDPAGGPCGPAVDRRPHQHVLVDARRGVGGVCHEDMCRVGVVHRDRKAREAVPVVAAVESRDRTRHVGVARHRDREARLLRHPRAARRVLVEHDVAAVLVDDVNEPVPADAYPWDLAAPDVERGRPVRAAILRADDRRVLIRRIEVAPGRIDLIPSGPGNHAVGRDVLLVREARARAAVVADDGVVDEREALAVVGGTEDDVRGRAGRILAVDAGRPSNDRGVEGAAPAERDRWIAVAARESGRAVDAGRPGPRTAPVLGVGPPAVCTHDDVTAATRRGDFDLRATGHRARRKTRTWQSRVPGGHGNAGRGDHGVRRSGRPVRRCGA